MKRAKCIVLALTLLTVSACASLLLPLPPGPEDPQSVAIGVSLVIRPPLRLFGLFHQETDITVYFIRLHEEKGTPDFFFQNTLYRSNYVHDNQVYLLNAKPGRYAAVLAFSERMPPPPPPGSEAPPVASGRPKYFWTYFPEDLIRHMEITVPPGAIRYMGDFVIDQAVGMKNADAAQDYYHRFVIYSHDKRMGDFLKGIEKGPDAIVGTILYYSIMDPASLSTTNVIVRVILFCDVHSAGSANSVDRSPQAEKAFLKKTSEQFQPTEWIPNIQKRLEELNAP